MKSEMIKRQTRDYFEVCLTHFFPLSSSAILREEVRYVHTDTDLMIMEKAARGKKDIVLGYVLSLGTRGMERM